ncbi:MAG: hypothetical protein IPP93_02400 [Chitinophagaceae bacterium]|nr:hypothetical protein [Chitinophagaceae bacterium]
MTSTATPKINGKYIILCALAVFLTWILHEFSHWSAGELLGLHMTMSLNRTFQLHAETSSVSNAVIISIAGPLFTLCQAVIVFFIIKKTKNWFLYPFLLVCFYMRFFAALVSFRKLNDEAWVSKLLGIGAYTLPIIFSGILFLLVYNTSHTNRYSRRFNLSTLGFIILFSSLLIVADSVFKIRIL